MSHPLPSRAIAAALFCFCAAVHAGQYYIDNVTPRIAQRGTTVDVTFNGSRLADPKEVHFYEAGIEASGLEHIKGEESSGGGGGGRRSPGNDKVKAKFKIAENCRLGEHLVRLRTSHFMGEAVTFWVTPFPVVQEKEAKLGENDTPATAQVVPLNSTITGTITSNEMMDRDCYRVELKKGQRLSAEVVGVRLASVHSGGDNDLTLRVLDPHGKELARNDDNPQFIQDPMLSIAAPEDGNYTVEVTQQMYQQTNNGWYVLHVGDFVRPTALYPMGGKAGEKIEARVIGDPLGERKETIELPKEPGDFAAFAGKSGEQPPTANVMRVCNYANVNEVEPNDLIANATPLTGELPAAFNGIIEKDGDVDCFRFKVEKGKQWRVRVYARSLGTAVDPKVWIRPLSNGQEGGNEIEKDDATLAERGFFHANNSWHPKDMLDPSFIFNPQKAGDYVLGVEDTRGQGGPAYVYRVEIEHLENRAVSFMPNLGNNSHYQYNFHIDIPQGARLTRTINLAAVPGTDFKGEMELEAVNLPKGVTMVAPKFKTFTTLPVQFIAAPDAELSGTLGELRIKPVDPKADLKSGSAQGIAYLDRRNGYGWHFVFVDKLAFAVTQAAPYSVELVQPEASLVQNAELALMVKIKRKEGFNAPVEIQPDWLPNGVSKESSVTIPAGQSEGKFVIHAENRAAVGTYGISMTAFTRGRDSQAYSLGLGAMKVSTNFVDLNVSSPYLTVVIKRAAVERGQRGQIVCELKINKQFSGKASAVLKRLPNGIKLIEPLPQIAATDTKAVFDIEASPDALVGQYKEIFCEVIVTENGQAIRQQTGSGILRIDPARVRVSAPAVKD